jgi:maltose O-acetyltransferase
MMKQFRLISQSATLALAHLISALLPPSRCFEFRRRVFVAAGIKIGKGTAISGGARFHGMNISIGDHTWVNGNTHFYPERDGCIQIGSRVAIAPGCLICTGTHEIGGSERRAGRSYGLSVDIGEGSWLCMGSMVLPGTVLGPGTIVAAGAVVRGHFPRNVLIAGVPGRVVKNLPAHEMDLEINK